MKKNLPQTNPAVGYLRRSTDRQEQSIEDQKKSVSIYAAENGFEIVKFYIDDAISGTSTKARKAFLQLISDAQDPGCSWRHVLVYDVKRFGRLDNDEAGYYRFILRQAGIEVLYVSENFSGDDTDDLLRPVKQWQARQESKDLSKVTIRGQVSLSQEGWWLGGAPPYGYDLLYHDSAGNPFMVVRFLPDGSKEVRDLDGKITRILPKGDRVAISKREHARLVPSAKDRIKTVKRIFSLYLDGLGFKTICHQLNSEGTPSPRNGEWARIHDGRWAMSTVRAIVINPIYKGNMVWNRRTMAKFHRISNGQAKGRSKTVNRKVEQNGEEDWVVIEDTHPPLVSEAVFERAQRLRKSRERRNAGTAHPTGRGKNSPYLLTGLIRCASCGHKFQAYTVTKAKSRKDGSRVRTHYYACGGYVSKGTSVCKRVLFRQEDLDTYVFDEVEKRLAQILQNGGKALLKTQIELLLGGDQEDPRPKMAKTRFEIAQIDEKADALLDMMTPETRDFVERKLDRLRAERRGLERTLRGLEETDFKPIDTVALATEILRETLNLKEIATHGSPEERKLFIRAFAEGMTLNPEEKRGELYMKEVPTPAGAGTSFAAIAGAGFEPATSGL